MGTFPSFVKFSALSGVKQILTEISRGMKVAAECKHYRPKTSGLNFVYHWGNCVTIIRCVRTMRLNEGEGVFAGEIRGKT
jgi:hypothetical protein